MRIRVPEINRPAPPPPMPGREVVDDENVTVLQEEIPRLPAALESQQRAVTQPAPPVGPTAEQLQQMAASRYNQGKNPAFLSTSNPEEEVARAAGQFVGDTEETHQAASVNDVPQLSSTSTMSDVAQAANNQAAGFGYTEPQQTDTDGGITQVPVSPSRFAESQQEQNTQVLKAEDLMLGTPEQRKETVSRISARAQANRRDYLKNEMEVADTTRTMEDRINSVRDNMSTPNPEFMYGYDPDKGEPTSAIEEIFRLAPASDRGTGGFLFHNEADVGAGNIKQQQIIRDILPAVISLAGPHAMHSLQLEARANSEGSANKAQMLNTYHHGVDANQMQHLLQSNIKEYFRNAKLGNMSDETAARVAQVAMEYYVKTGEVTEVANPDPLDRVKRPVLYESTQAGKAAINQLKVVGEGLFGGVREGFYTAPALNLIGRLGEFTKSSLGVLSKIYKDIMNMKKDRGELGISGHELTKIIKGSVAEGTTLVNLQSNDAMFTSVSSEAVYIEPGTATPPVKVKDPSREGFTYSTHPAAKLFGLSEADYKAYKADYSPPKDNNGKFRLAPIENERRAAAHAQQQMTERFNEFRNTTSISGSDTTKILMTALEKKQPLYSRFVNSLLNNRFYRTNLVYNPEGNKYERNLSNFVEQPLLHNKIFSYDEGRLLNLQSQVKVFETNLGADVTQRLHRDFTLQEQSALGMMAILSKLYLELNPNSFTGTGKPKNLTPWQLIGQYNKGVHQWAIEQGALVDTFITGIDPSTGEPLTPEARADLDKQLGDLYSGGSKPWSTIEEGELGSFFNPLVDAYRLSKATPQAPHRITTTIGMDVTQSGPALTGLITTILNTEGGTKTLRALYAPGWVNPDGSITGEKDLRGQMAAGTPKIIREIIQDEDQAKSMMNIVRAMDDEGLLEKFYKFPIMTTIYTRDSGSFGDDIDRFFIENGLSATVDTIAQAYKGGRKQLRKDWASVMKAGLDTTLSTEMTKFMSGLGSYTAMAGVALSFDMPTGAPLLIASTGIRPARKDKSLDLLEGPVNAEGDKVVTSLYDAEGRFNLETGIFEEVLDPTATKGTAWYLNPDRTAWVKHTNPAGTKQARQAGVNWVHGLDASAIELMYLAVNATAMTEGVKLKGVEGLQRLSAVPAYSVHDAVFTTPAGMLHYHNAYNNVVIPQLINWMRDSFVPQIEGKLLETRNNFKKKLEEKGSTTIGMLGDNANISSQLDTLWLKFWPEGSTNAKEYEEYYIGQRTNEPDNKQNPQTKKAYADLQSYKERSKATLETAIKSGYKTPGSHLTRPLSSFPADTTFKVESLLTDASERANRDAYTVDKDKALALFDLVAKDLLRLNVFDTEVGRKHNDFIARLKAGPQAALNFFREDTNSIRKYGLNSLKL